MGTAKGNVFSISKYKKNRHQHPWLMHLIYVVIEVLCLANNRYTKVSRLVNYHLNFINPDSEC